MNNTIEERRSKDKKQVLEFLRKAPIVQVACERANVSRASYYRWRKEDKQFAMDSDKALQDGNLLVNDMAESQLMNAIKDRDMTAIIFWLKNHHPAYLTRVEITAVNKPNETLNPEQEKAVQKALLMAGVIPQPIDKPKK